ncbi:hypothetical protein HELRODRAFT_185899 [Helobdella robusta]|uniref:Peptidase S1 domain-containing protein n=1 Tax=Helobdella robusta TaxID=6412 RepID=T1FNE9_HELRO|nr:hypothetical protein HELRODRAFT_185899 [Helobdella robusta]ESN97485.1 hypothetical protein HELRODRAFT_185899 [Helobdella robusta]
MMKMLVANLLVIFLAAVHAAPESRIVGGVKADKGEWPWQMALYASGRFSCGASIVAATWGVTAAHCVGGLPVTYKILAGTNTNNLICSVGHCVTRSLRNATRHPEYSGSGALGYPNDIAYISWAEPINEVSTVNMTVKYVQRATSTNYVGKNCYITGWGRLIGGGVLPKDLVESKIDVITKEQCQAKWGSRITDKHVCVHDLKDYSSGACNGDSGDPLVCEDSPKVWKLVGATSWGSAGCGTSMPSVYTRISSYNQWLDSQAKP